MSTLNLNEGVSSVLSIAIHFFPILLDYYHHIMLLIFYVLNHSSVHGLSFHWTSKGCSRKHGFEV